MGRPGSDKGKTGMEISDQGIRGVTVSLKGELPLLKHMVEIPLPGKVVRPQFRKENILDEQTFVECMQKSLARVKTGAVSVSLPDACMKVFIKKFGELPEKKQDIDDMVLWNISGALKIPADSLRVSWSHMGKNGENSNVILVAIGLADVLQQYETLFRKCRVSASWIAPSGLNRFNFYAEKIEETGITGYLGLFHDHLTAFVFSDSVPVFYKVFRKQLADDQETSAIENVDLLVQYFQSEYPEFPVDRFYIASHIKSQRQIKDMLEDLSYTHYSILEETQLVRFDKTFSPDPGQKPLSFFSGALGAIKSARKGG